MHSWRFYAHSYRHWVTDNAINETGRRTIELNNSGNRTVVVFQVKKSHQKNKPVDEITRKGRQMSTNVAIGGKLAAWSLLKWRYVLD